MHSALAGSLHFVLEQTVHLLMPLDTTEVRKEGRNQHYLEMGFSGRTSMHMTLIDEFQMLRLKEGSKLLMDTFTGIHWNSSCIPVSQRYNGRLN
jgi:hypothetical protein